MSYLSNDRAAKIVGNSNNERRNVKKLFRFYCQNSSAKLTVTVDGYFVAINDRVATVFSL
jgi:hypothetical protein